MTEGNLRDLVLAWHSATVDNREDQDYGAEFMPSSFFPFLPNRPTFIEVLSMKPDIIHLHGVGPETDEMNVLKSEDRDLAIPRLNLAPDDLRRSEATAIRCNTNNEANPNMYSALRVVYPSQYTLYAEEGEGEDNNLNVYFLYRHQGLLASSTLTAVLYGVRVGELLRGSEVLKVVVIRIHLHLVWQPFKIRSPMFENLNYRQHFLVIDVVVQLGGSKGT
ncbi:hypothetical protein V5O48_018184, partial [Marasmius crinis-equi]